MHTIEYEEKNKKRKGPHPTRVLSDFQRSSIEKTQSGHDCFWFECKNKRKSRSIAQETKDCSQQEFQCQEEGEDGRKSVEFFNVYTTKQYRQQFNKEEE